MSTLKNLTISLGVLGVLAILYGFVGILTEWPPSLGKVETFKIPAPTNIERALSAMDLSYAVVPVSLEVSKKFFKEYTVVKIETQDEFLNVLSEAKGFSSNEISKTFFPNYRFGGYEKRAYVYGLSMPKVRVWFMYGEQVVPPPSSLKFANIYIKTPAEGDTELLVGYDQKVYWFIAWFGGGGVLVLVLLFISAIRHQGNLRRNLRRTL